MYIYEDSWPPNFDRKWFCVGSIFCIWDYFAGCPTKCFPTLRQKYLIVSRQHLRKLHNRISSGSSLQDFPSHFLISWSTLKDFPPPSVHLGESTNPLHYKIKQKKVFCQWWLWCPLPFFSPTITPTSFSQGSVEGLGAPLTNLSPHFAASDTPSFIFFAVLQEDQKQVHIRIKCALYYLNPC